MRKIFAFLFAFATLYSYSQTSCASAAPFCAGGTSGITFPATTVTAVSNSPAGPFYGCLGTTPNAAWYYMQIGNSGPLDLLIQGQQPNGNAGFDVDFICWGPFSSLTNICSNANLSSTHTVDCSYSTSATETLNIGNGVTGQFYMVLITNFSNQAQNIIFTQTGGTGNTNCSILQASSPTICAGSTATIVASNNSNLGSPNYSISPPNAAPNSTGSFVVAPTVSTNYTIYVTGLNSANVIITETTTSGVVVNPQPTIAPTFTQTTCTNTLSALNLNLHFNPVPPNQAATPAYTITWSSIPSQLGSSTSTTVSPVDPNFYTTTVVAAGGCSTVAQFTINPQPALATFTLIPLTNVFSVTCAQPTVVIDATNNALTYTWTNGSAAPVYDNEALFTVNTLGTWTITGKNPSSGCIASHTFLVVQNTVTPSSVVTPSFQNITCLNGAITVTSTSNATVNITQYFTFNGPGGTYSTSANSPTAIVLPPIGNHAVCVVNNLNGCSSCKTFSIVSSDNIPTINVTSPENYTLGCGTHSVAHVALTGSTTPQGGGVEYALASPAFTGTNYAFSGSQSVYSITAPGTWTAVIRDQTSHCLIKASFSIIQDIAGPDIAAFNPHPILNCDTNATVLTAITSNTNVTFAWSYPSQAGPVTVVNSTVAAGTNTNHNIALAANYTLSITDNHNACISTSIVPVAQNLYIPVAVISGGVTFSLTCANPTVQLTNNSTHNTAMGAAGYPTNLPVIGYIWAGPPPQAPLQVSSNYVAGLAGVYTLTAKDLNNGCIGTATTNVLENRIVPILDSPGEVIFACGTASAVVTLTPGAGTKYRYDWSTSSPTVNAAPNQPTLGVLGTGPVGVTITNTVNGCSSFIRANVSSGTLTADVSADHISGYAPLNVTFYNHSFATTTTGRDSSGIVTVWSFANGSQTTIPSSSISPSTSYAQSGTYKVLAYASKGVCQSVDTLTITVDVPSRLEIPNVFTPNGDNVNDLFFLKVANLTEIHMQIFDRWGHNVYDLTSETGNIAWDGKTETGKDAAAGTYFYIIKATGKDGQSYDTKGTVNLYR